jgi:hypothetical protein
MTGVSQLSSEVSNPKVTTVLQCECECLRKGFAVPISYRQLIVCYWLRLLAASGKRISFVPSGVSLLPLVGRISIMGKSGRLTDGSAHRDDSLVNARLRLNTSLRSLIIDYQPVCPLFLRAGCLATPCRRRVRCESPSKS